MAQEITVDLGVKPTLDMRATNSLISDLEKSLRKVQTGTHLNLAKRISSVYDKLIEAGLASTPTGARIAFSKLAGGKFKEGQQGVLRLAEGMTAKRLTLKQQEEKRQQIIGSLSARAAMLQQKAELFKEEPNEENKALLIGGIVGIRREVLKLYQEYRVNRRQIPPILRQIAQNTSSLKKEISDFDSEKPTEQTSSNASFLKKIVGTATGISGVMTLLKKGGQAAINALNRGAQAMRLQASYGKDVNWGDVRARAGIFNMSLESAAAPSEYASDFRQRMMWGEVSEREIIGLSRMGQWGRMVMSGEAARNPDKANAVFENMVATTNQAEMRSKLRQVGLPQDLMQYNIQGYDKATREENNQKFADIAEKEWEAAVKMYDAGNQYQLAAETISGVLAETAGKGVQYISPQGRMVARNLGVESVTDAQLRDTQKTISSGAELIKKATGNPFAKIAADMFNVILEPRQGNTYNPTVNQTNYYTINGANEETAEMFGSKVDEATSKALYNAQVNSTPGAISGVGG